MTSPRHCCKHGWLIVFEGLDGAGKTTQIRLVAERLQREGHDVICLKEPTEGPWGQQLRHLAQHGREGVAPETELALFLQDRREDVLHNIQPALARGQIVLLDRYYFSTIAYQGALQLDPAEIQRQNEAFAPLPDLLLILTVPPELGLQRVKQRGALSHFERLAYLQRVAVLFAEMQFPYLSRIDATADVMTVHERIWALIATLISADTVSKKGQVENSGTAQRD